MDEVVLEGSRPGLPQDLVNDLEAHLVDVGRAAEHVDDPANCRPLRYFDDVVLVFDQCFPLPSMPIDAHLAKQPMSQSPDPL